MSSAELSVFLDALSQIHTTNAGGGNFDTERFALGVVLASQDEDEVKIEVRISRGEEAFAFVMYYGKNARHEALRFSMPGGAEMARRLRAAPGAEVVRLRTAPGAEVVSPLPVPLMPVAVKPKGGREMMGDGLKTNGVTRDSKPAHPVGRYVVQSGDTLFGIALTCRVTVKDLARWNNIHDPDKIAVGQELILADTGTALNCDRPK